MYIKIEKNPDGSHSFQSGGVLENGWAAVPKDIKIPDTFPFVNFEVAEVTHPEVTSIKKSLVDGEYIENTVVLVPEYTQLEVVSMTEGEEVLIEESEYISKLDIIEAQVAYTAMMTDTLLEG